MFFAAQDCGLVTLVAVADIESPLDVEWSAESNPDRVLDPR